MGNKRSIQVRLGFALEAHLKRTLNAPKKYDQPVLRLEDRCYPVVIVQKVGSSHLLNDDSKKAVFEMVITYSAPIITSPAPTQTQTQKPSPARIQKFNPIWHVRERYLSPTKTLSLLDKRDVYFWGHRSVDEFLVFVDTLSQEETDARFNRAARGVCISEKSLREWAAKLKLRSNRRGGYQATEVEVLDDYYRALHMVGMKFPDFNEKVIRQGITLNQYLGI